MPAGKIEVSRSIGDLQFKKCGMSAVPDIQVFHLSQQDRFLLCGCDGFWSCFSPEDAVQAVAEMIEKGKPLKAICDRLIYLVGHGAMYCLVIADVLVLPLTATHFQSPPGHTCMHL